MNLATIAWLCDNNLINPWMALELGSIEYFVNIDYEIDCDTTNENHQQKYSSILKIIFPFNGNKICKY